MTPDQERWAEALVIEHRHGDDAGRWLIERSLALARAGDVAGVQHLNAIAGRLGRLHEARRGLSVISN